MAPARGQSGTPAAFAPSRHDVSPPLRDIPPAARPSGPPREAREPGRLPPKGPQAEQFDSVTQTWSGPLAIPSTSRNFEGLGQGFTGPQGTMTVNSAPPDTDGDVGPNHYVQVVNTDFAVFSKSGTVLYGPAPTRTLWSGFGGGCQTNNDGDAVVKYDKRANRWIVEQFSVNTTPYMQCLAISTTGDPTGSYFRYSYTFTNFPDYPKLSVWPDGYYITYNMFTPQGNYVGGEVCAYDRSTMLSGGAATAQCFAPVSSMGGSLPSDLDGPTDPPAGSPNYVVTFGTNSLLLWKVHVDWGNKAQSSLTGPTSISTASFTIACSQTGTCIPQPNTTVQLDSLSDRVMMRLGYRNFADHEALVVNHSVKPSGSGVGVSGVRWYEIRSPESSPSIFQQGTYAPADGKSRWMGSMAMDGAGDIGAGFSVSSGSVFPSISYTGRLVGDPLGTLPQGEASIQAGGGSQTTYTFGGTTYPLTRWGDYSSLSVDPVDDCTFWFTTEYLTADGAFNWHTRIGSFKFGSCASCTPPATPVITAPSKANPGDSGLIASVANHAGSTYAWTIVDGTIDSGNGTSQITFTAGAEGALTLQVVETNSSGCSSAAGSASVTVGSSPPPAAGPLGFYTLVPCRLVDTRLSDGPYGGPSLDAGTARSFVLAGQCGIPADAKSVSVNVTVVGPTAAGYVTAYPTGVPSPVASTISYSAGRLLANNALFTLGVGGSVTIEDHQTSGTVDFVLDTNGYFK